MESSEGGEHGTHRLGSNQSGLKSIQIRDEEQSRGMKLRFADLKSDITGYGINELASSSGIGGQDRRDSLMYSKLRDAS